MPGVIDECRGLRSTHEVIYNARETLNRAASQGGGGRRIAPEGAPTIEPKFWNGFKVRHALLLPITFLTEYLVSRQMADASPLWIALGALVLVYAILLIRNPLTGQGASGA